MLTSEVARMLCLHTPVTEKTSPSGQRANVFREDSHQHARCRVLLSIKAASAPVPCSQEADEDEPDGDDGRRMQVHPVHQRLDVAAHDSPTLRGRAVAPGRSRTSVVILSSDRAARAFTQSPSHALRESSIVVA